MINKNKENKFYEIIGALANANENIIFKGAMVTKLYLNKELTKVERSTKDIDADWIGTPPTWKN